MECDFNTKKIWKQQRYAVCFVMWFCDKIYVYSIAESWETLGSFPASLNVLKTILMSELERKQIISNPWTVKKKSRSWQPNVV